MFDLPLPPRFNPAVRELLLNEEIHPRVVIDLIPQARRFLWIVTADIKDMHVARSRRSVPFLNPSLSVRDFESLRNHFFPHV
jgi:hypothetical protein